MSLRAVGTGLDYDGVDDYVAIQNLHYDSAEEIGEITVCAWVKSSSDQKQIIISFDRSEYWRLSLVDDQGNGQVAWDTASPSTVHDMGPTTSYTDGEWHHICAWFKKGASPDKKLFVDGKVVSSATAHNGEGLGTGTTRYGFIGVGSEAESYDGNKGPSYWMYGIIDSVRIYNRALSAEEVQALYRNKRISNEGLVLYLPLNAGSGDTAKDFSGQGNNGTINGAQWYGFRPVRSGGLQYDGVDDYVEVPNDASLQSKEFSVSFWIYQRSYKNWWHHVHKECWAAGGSNYSWSFHSGANGNIYFRIRDNTIPVEDGTSTLLPLNVWVFFTGVYSADGTIKLYKNGAFVNSDSQTITFDNTQNIDPLRIGDTTGMNGTIALVRIYTRALSDQEIADLYLGKEIDRTGLVLDMPMNEGQGSVAHDYSGEGNNGDIIGARWYGNMPIKRTISAKRAIAVKR